MAGALGLVITTDVPIEGRRAVPVYVDDTLPIVGPSRACVVTTGEIPQAGGPPLAVRLAPPGTPAIGPALPVYVVPGGGSLGGAPPSTLLNGLISYWKLDEASGVAIDSAGGNTLTDNNTVTSAAGKVAGARQYTRANSESHSIASNAGLSSGNIDYSIAFWAFCDTIPTMGFVAKGNEYRVIYDPGAGVFKFLWNADTGLAQSAFIDPTGLWTFVVAWHNATLNTVNLQLNNGAIVTVAHTGGLNDAGAFVLGSSSGFLNGRLDEFGIWKRVLTVAERTVLYNAGNGVTYPFLGL